VTGKGLLAALRYVSTPFLQSPSVLSPHIFIGDLNGKFCKSIHEHLVWMLPIFLLHSKLDVRFLRQNWGNSKWKNQSGSSIPWQSLLNSLFTAISMPLFHVSAPSVLSFIYFLTLDLLVFPNACYSTTLILMSKESFCHPHTTYAHVIISSTFEWHVFAYANACKTHLQKLILFI